MDQLTRPNMQPDWLEPFLTHLKWPVFDAQPVWLATWLTQPEPDPTRTSCFAMSIEDEQPNTHSLKHTPLSSRPHTDMYIHS